MYFIARDPQYKSIVNLLIAVPDSHTIFKQLTNSLIYRQLFDTYLATHLT